MNQSFIHLSYLVSINFNMKNKIDFFLISILFKM